MDAAKFRHRNPKRNRERQRSAADVKADGTVRKRKFFASDIGKYARKTHQIPPQKIPRICGKHFPAVHVAEPPLVPLVGQFMRKKSYIFWKI